MLQRFAAEVNGPLMIALAEKAGYHDVDCVELFRDGAPLVGKLKRPSQHSFVCDLSCCVRFCFVCRTGNGVPREAPPKQTLDELRKERRACVCMHVFAAARL